MLFLTYDENYQKITVDTADFKVSPNGTGLRVRTYPEHNQENKKTAYQGCLALAKYMDTKDRKEFEDECKRILADARATKKKKRADARVARKAVLAKD